MKLKDSDEEESSTSVETQKLMYKEIVQTLLDDYCPPSSSKSIETHEIKDVNTTEDTVSQKKYEELLEKYELEVKKNEDLTNQLKSSHKKISNLETQIAKLFEGFENIFSKAQMDIVLKNKKK